MQEPPCSPAPTFNKKRPRHAWGDVTRPLLCRPKRGQQPKNSGNEPTRQNAPAIAGYQATLNPRYDWLLHPFANSLVSRLTLLRSLLTYASRNAWRFISRSLSMPMNRSTSRSKSRLTPSPTSTSAPSRRRYRTRVQMPAFRGLLAL